MNNIIYQIESNFVMKAQINQLMSSLRKEGFRITPQRIAIVEYIMNTEEHPSAEQIYQIIKKDYPTVSLSTVYKTLDLLRKKRLVNEIEVNGESRFDANVDEHLNLVCIRCGKIEDVDDKSIKEIQLKASKKSRYLIVRSSFDLYGYCGDCKSKLEK